MSMPAERIGPGRVESGLEVLLAARPELLRRQRFGLLINATSVDARLVSAPVRILALDGTSIGALFAPEHGILGVAQDMEAIGQEQWHGTPVHSLYGSGVQSLRPDSAWLAGLDIVVYDIQDVGTRYYTFLATLSHMMEAAREAGVTVVVCDRPNPIGAMAVEGPTVRPGFESFVGRFPVATRHGLTTGEMARLMNEHFGIGCRLEVVPMSGYRRAMWFDETGLPWVLPSPNMPTLDTATVYPGACLLEGTNLSEGRGTTRPFELVGAPWIDGEALAESLNELSLAGVRFRPAAFIPKHQKWKDQPCRGVQVHVTDRASFRSLPTYVALIQGVARLHPRDFAWRRDAYEFVTDRPAIDLLAGNDELRRQIERGVPIDEIEASWEPERQRYLELRERVLLYR